MNFVEPIRDMQKLDELKALLQKRSERDRLGSKVGWNRDGSFLRDRSSRWIHIV